LLGDIANKEFNRLWLRQMSTFEW